MAYLTVLYPATSHTFIHREVIGLRERGVEVATYSLNGVDRSGLLTDFERNEQANTMQIKALPKARIARVIAKHVLRHPLAAFGTLRMAVGDRGFDLGSRIKSVFQVGEALVLLDDCRSKGITHVHAHFGQAPANVAWFATDFAHRIGLADWSFSVTIHGPQDCLAEGDRTLQRKVGAASVVISVSDFTAAQLLRRIDVTLWDRVEVVRCGVDTSARFADADLVNEPQIDREREEPTVLMVARISPEKGHVMAIEALAQLRARGVHARLRLVGPGDPEAFVLPSARRLGVDDLVDVVGPLDPDRVAAEFRRATVFALPSFAEGLPIVIMESMVNGCPVVASAISGIPELVEDGVTGLLVPPARADLLADALAELLEDPVKRSELAEAGRRRVAELHEGQRQLDALIQVLTNHRCLGPTTSAPHQPTELIPR